MQAARIGWGSSASARSPAARARSLRRNRRRRTGTGVYFRMIAFPSKSSRFNSARRAPQDRRTIRLHGSRRTPFRRAPAIISISRRPASRPSSLRFMSMVVSAGRVASARISQLSKPTIDTASGTPTPRSRRPSAMPRAIWSLPQTMPSGAAARRRTARSSAWRPQASDQAPVRQCRPAPAGRRRATRRDSPGGAGAPPRNVRGRVTWAMRRRPSLDEMFGRQRRRRPRRPGSRHRASGSSVCENT